MSKTISFEAQKLTSNDEEIRSRFSGLQRDSRQILFFFGLLRNCLNCNYNCEGHMFISLVFSQFTSFNYMFHSFHGLMNLINWPGLHVWVFISQLVEHCSANAEATCSNPR